MMVTTTKLDKDEQDKNVDIKLYRSMICNFTLLFVHVVDSNLVLKNLI